MIIFVTVSVPEKTLEHWSSQYLTYRYRSRAGLWWPPVREDIEIHHLPAAPGKIVNLELKTTVLDGGNPSRHHVRIDVDQLCLYLKRPLGRQPFYAFPWADWTGQLTTSARQHGVNSCEIGFSRVNNTRSGWWFADWMRVMTAAEVGQVIGHRPHRGKCQQGSVKQLVRFDVPGTGAPTLHWASPPTHEPTRWRDLWGTLQTCGRPDWPQIVLVPASLASGRSVLGRADLQEVFARTHERAAPADEPGDEIEDMGEVEVEYFEPDGEGNFRRLEVLDDQEPDVDSTELPSGERHALAVHLAGSLIFPPSRS
jgi:hypothetical protein